MGIGKGLGKLIFFGEHAAVHGYPALGTSLPWKISVEHETSEEGVWEFPSLPSSYRQPLLDVLKSLEDSLGHRLNRGILRLKSDVPIGSGFGSSGALCAALVQALNPGTFQENWKLAHEAEKNFHGKPSGIDTALALREGITAFTPREKGLPTPETLPGFNLHLVVGAIPREQSTKDLVQGISKRVLDQEPKVLEIMKQLGTLAENAINSLKKGTASGVTWGLWANQAQELLEALNLTNPLLESILTQGRKVGSLGGKLSGAGGGGAFFLIYPDAQAAQAGKKDLKEWGQLKGLSWTREPEALRWDMEYQKMTLGRSAFDSLFGG